MTTLEKTSKEIRRLVPRLMELGFGCEVIGYHDWKENKNGEWEFTKTNDVCTSYDGRRWCICVNGSYDEYEIIGHPITLVDVLEAIGRDFVLYHEKDAVCFYSKGSEEFEFRWQYGKPYDQQSPEVHEFVANILFNK